MVVIFFFSGLILQGAQIRTGITDTTPILAALGLIFVAAPFTGAVFGLLHLNVGLTLGIFLVAVMPTTISTGVVMTGAAGGNPANAFAVTLLANGLAVFTIPLSLGLLLSLIDTQAVVTIDKAAIMLKLIFLVLTPLGLSLGLKRLIRPISHRLGPIFQVSIQVLIIAIVWMSLSHSKAAILQGGHMVGLVFLLAFAFHALLLLQAAVVVRVLKLGPGRRESVIFMGTQKTLALSILLQVSLFPDYGLVLVVCVVHHFVHLLVDGYLVGRLQH